MIQYIKIRKKLKQTERELTSMTDRELADIGLNRGDIPGILQVLKGELLDG